jgi:hypothetical protein
MNKIDLLRWLRGKLSEAEQSLRCREEMANPTPFSKEELEIIKALPSARVTKGRKLSKAEINDLKEEHLRHQRIAVKIRRDVDMLRAVITTL